MRSFAISEKPTYRDERRERRRGRQRKRCELTPEASVEQMKKQTPPESNLRRHPNSTDTARPSSAIFGRRSGPLRHLPAPPHFLRQHGNEVRIQQPKRKRDVGLYVHSDVARVAVQRRRRRCISISTSDCNPLSNPRLDGRVFRSALLAAAG